MRKHFLLPIAVVFALACNEKNETSTRNTDWMADNLKGEVKQIVESPYKTDSTGKVGEMDSCCIEVSEYDSAGNIAKAISKDSKGTINREQVFTKYDDGLFKEMVITNKGKMANRISIVAEKGKYTSAQEFDSAGKLAFFYKDISQNEYAQLTSMKKYKPDSTLSNTFETTYDKQIYKGQSAKDSSGKETSRSVVKVDDKGNQVEVSNTNTMKDPKTNKDTTTTKVTKYKYDSFDEAGNWTQRTEMDEKGKPTKIFKREISYYKK